MAHASTGLLSGRSAPQTARTGLAAAATLAVLGLLIAASGRGPAALESVRGMERRQELEHNVNQQLAARELSHYDQLNAELFPKEDTGHTFTDAAAKSDAANRWFAKHRCDSPRQAGHARSV
jgi:hypothetical protein